MRRLTAGWFEADERLLWPIFLIESFFIADAVNGFGVSSGSRSGAFEIAEESSSEGLGPVNEIP